MFGDVLLSISGRTTNEETDASVQNDAALDKTRCVRVSRDSQRILFIALRIIV